MLGEYDGGKKKKNASLLKKGEWEEFVERSTKKGKNRGRTEAQMRSAKLGGGEEIGGGESIWRPLDQQWCKD